MGRLLAEETALDWASPREKGTSARRLAAAKTLALRSSRGKDAGKNPMVVLLRASASGARGGTGWHGDGAARRKGLDFGGNGLER